MIDLLKSLSVVVERLHKAIRSDNELRGELRNLARFILTITEEEQPGPQAEMPPQEVEQVADEVDVAPAVAPVEPKPQYAPADLSKLDIGSMAEPDQSPHQQIQRFAPAAVDESKLPLIEKRLSMKAEGSRWMAKRHQLLAAGADFATEIEPQDREIIRRAKLLEDCFLWMNHPSCPTVEDHGFFEQLGDCYEVAGNAVALLRRILSDRERFESHLEAAMYLAAESQSMVRGAVADIGQQEDNDQLQLFQFLKALAFQEQTFINRYMKNDDLADPTRWEGVQDRIDAIDSKIDEVVDAAKRRKKHFNAIRYHIKRIEQRPGDNTHDWNKIVSETAMLVEEGMPPSNVELRDLLVDLVDDIPEDVDVPDAARRVLDAIDRFLSERTSIPETTVAEIDTPAVKEVASLLRGQSVLMIGGVPRPYAKAALERAFELKELLWKRTNEHNARLDCEAEVSKPDLAVVLLAIRWTRHAYGDVKVTCDLHGKPLVRLPRGYNPKQVAEEILRQASEQLREMIESR